MREEVRRTHERAEAMEAASALLNESDDLPLSARESGASSHAPRWSENYETRKGTRNTHGAVALTNVPLMNGGGAPSPAAAGCSPEAAAVHAPSPATATSGGGKIGRKASFSRKAGRKLVRSLSFSYDDRKRS